MERFSFETIKILIKTKNAPIIWYKFKVSFKIINDKKIPVIGIKLVSTPAVDIEITVKPSNQRRDEITETKTP